MSKKTILVVDDDVDTVMSIKAILRSKGHTVITAYGAAEGLKKYTSGNPDIILLDLMMEKVDSGITLCREIRKTDRKSKIYLLSAVGDETANTLDTHDIGFDGAMSKPVSPDELLLLVE